MYAQCVFVFCDRCSFTERWRLTHLGCDSISDTMNCAACHKYEIKKREKEMQTENSSFICLE